MKILVYFGKYGEEYWLADTPRREELALRELFEYMDGEGYYDDDQRHLERARDGDMEAIRYILTTRDTCEYEQWSFEEITVPNNRDVPGEAELLDFNAYQTHAHALAVYPRETGLLYTALGLAGESGEVAEKIIDIIVAGLWVAKHAGEVANQVKKVARGDDNGLLTLDRKKRIASEIGGVLWYAAELATILEIDFAEIPAENLRVLYSRQARGKLKGDGDNR